MTRIIALILTLTPVAATASNSMSKELAECAGMLSAMEVIVHGEEKRDWLQSSHAQWTALAVREARLEGINAPKAYAAAHSSAKQAEWLDQGPMFVFTDEFRNWTAYCGNLARAHGLQHDEPTG